MDVSTATFGDDQARLERLRRWDGLCDKLERSWERDETPDLRVWVEQVPADERLELLKRLLPLDMECRQKRSRQPTVEEFYAALLPSFGHEISRLLQSDASASDAAETDNGGSAQPPAERGTSTITPPTHDPYATVPPDVAADKATAPVTAPHADVPRFGSFEILGTLGEGAMGLVLKARDSLGRVVALKTIRTAAAGSDEAIARFRQEARHAARLDHEGIVRVFEAGEHAGQHYISHEFIDGQSLKHRIKDAPLAPRDAAGIVRQIAEAVQFAHDRNIVHRDLKPENVLIGTDGKPRVADFGLAKALDDDSTNTQAGSIFGTPAYMPPEQARGEIECVGPLSDIYSIGATLYCLVTGRPPFQAANPQLTLAQVIADEPVSPRLLNPSIDRDLETICLKCLQKEPNRRYPSARDLAHDLERHMRDFPIKARPVSRLEHARRWIRRNLAISIVLSVMAILIGVSSLAVYELMKAEQLKVLDQNAKIQGSRNQALADRNQALADLQRENSLLTQAGELLIESQQPALAVAGVDLLRTRATTIEGPLPSINLGRHRVWDLFARGLLRPGDAKAFVATAKSEIERRAEGGASVPGTTLELVLAEALLDRNRLNEVEKLLLAAHDALVVLEPRSDAQLLHCRALLVRYYEAASNLDAADKWRASPEAAEAEIPSKVHLPGERR